MAGIVFHKVECCGNDFIVIPGATETQWESWLREPADIAGRLLDRRFGIGGDGLFLISEKGDVTHLDPDGSASFCVNGSICLSMLAQFETGIPISFNLNGIPIQCVTIDDLPAVRFRPDFLEIADVTLDGQEFRYVFIGNPHLFIETEELNPDANRAFARSLRHHAKFPEGVNVSFWKQTGDQTEIATFERGVEDFTPCCGSACAAFTAGISNRTTIRFRPPSNRDLTVEREGVDGFLTVRGEAHHVFEGRCLLS